MVGSESGQGAVDFSDGYFAFWFDPVEVRVPQTGTQQQHLGRSKPEAGTGLENVFSTAGRGDCEPDLKISHRDAKRFALKHPRGRIFQ